MVLTASHVAPSLPAALALGFLPVNVPLLGGTLVPAPQLLLVGVTSPGGNLAVPVPWPSFPPGTNLYFQVWELDPATIQGASATNGLLISI